MDKWSPIVDWPEGVVLPSTVAGDAGLTRGLARGSGWVKTSHGRFVPADADRNLAEQRILEQAAQLPAIGAITGWAALRLRGARYFDGMAADGSTRLPVPVALPPEGNLRPATDRTVLRGKLTSADFDLVHGVRCMKPLRAVYDEVRRVGELREAVVVLDMALIACFVTRGELEALVVELAGRPGIRLLRSALGLATTRSCSPQETRTRLVWVLDAGLPTPLCNWPVADLEGRFLGKPDLLCPELGTFGEYDGSEHRKRDRHRSDVGRESAFWGVGLEGFKVVAGDLETRPVVVRRMLDAVERRQASGRPRCWMLKANPRPLWP